jgi:hypothetical protein
MSVIFPLPELVIHVRQRWLFVTNACCYDKLRKLFFSIYLPGFDDIFGHEEAKRASGGVGFAQEFAIPGRRAAASPEPIFRRPVFMGSGFASFGRAPE